MLCLNTGTCPNAPDLDETADKSYLLLVNFGSICDAEIDGVDIAATHSQVERTASGLVQVVDVQASLVAIFLPWQ